MPKVAKGNRNGFTLMSKALKGSNTGFTLIELLVVVSIIAVLSLIGVTVYSSAQGKARDTKRRADIDAISNALEVHFGEFKNTAYAGLCQQTVSPAYDCSGKWFATGSLPTVPGGGPSGDRYCWVASGTCTLTGTGTTLSAGQPPADLTAWTICATMENATATGTTYCKSNQQ